MLNECYKARPLHLNPSIGMNDRELKDYSITRAISSVAQSGKVSGLELEVSNAVAKKVRRDPQGFFIPHDVACRSLADAHGLTPWQMAAMGAGLDRLMQPRAALSSGSAAGGGYLVGTQVLGSSLIELLRNAALVSQLGAMSLSGLVTPRRVSWPSKESGVSPLKTMVPL